VCKQTGGGAGNPKKARGAKMICAKCRQRMIQFANPDTDLCIACAYLRIKELEAMIRKLNSFRGLVCSHCQNKERIGQHRCDSDVCVLNSEALADILAKHEVTK
jgi:hypothetical protein